MGEADGQFSPESSSAKGEDLSFQGVLDEIQALAETDLPNPPSAEEVKGASELMAASHVDQDSAKESDATVEVAETNLLKIISDRMDTLDKIIPYFEKHKDTSDHDMYKWKEALLTRGQLEKIERDYSAYMLSEAWKHKPLHVRSEAITRITKQLIETVLKQVDKLAEL